ncbi:hypothetical protein Tco_0442666 [Tanacetum coccineum]
MTTLQFVDTHNLVAFLAKPAESEGFEQIATVKVKTVNGEVQLQALVDVKKVIITEVTIRRDLQLEDAEGFDCLPNAAIFEQLTLMGSTMASAIICLATNQKFNFSKYIFESMVKNLESMGKFLMYPRFVQVFLDNQLEEMSSHKRIYVTPSHTNKIFGNMKRIGKGFSGNTTPLFPTMMVQAQQEPGKGLDMPTDPHHTPTIIQPSTTQPQKKQRPRKPKRKDIKIPQSCVPVENVADEAVYEERGDRLERAATTATSLDAEQDRGNISKTQSKATPNEPSSLGTSSGGVNTPRSDDDRLKLKELMELCTNLQKKGRINAIDADENIYLVNVERDEDMFGVNDLEGDEVVVESKVAAKKKDDEVDVVEEVVSTAGDAALVSAATITTVELTLAQTLAELKSARPKAKELIHEQEPSESITTTTITTTAGIRLQEPSKTR